MTEERRRTMAHDGATKVPLSEGYIRKGGSNPPSSQIQTRPPAPAPMRPATSPSPSAPKSSGSGGTKQG
jgi:hypothetical protein